VPEALDHVAMWSGGTEHHTPVFERHALLAGDRLSGPALVREANATTVVEPGWTAEVTAQDHMLLRRTEPRPGHVATASGRPDPVLLELFNNLFMNVAEQTGAVLQNTSLSVNIKERLDFSCAIFDAEGGLVANAPHVPVHLGAMGESVRTVLRTRGASLRPGDVVALNNPFNGGTHLPDVTVITPVFGVDGRIQFFVGSRGHHADIGGTTPGSTPPDSRTLEDEGVVIDDFLLVDDGVFQEAGFRALLSGARYPARSPDVNVADIKAQVAANQRGVQELARVVHQFGWETVQAYMQHVMDNAEESVRRVLGRLGAVALDLQEVEDHRVMHHPVHGGHGGHGVLEDLSPVGEHQVGGDDHAAPLVAVGQQGEEHLHLLPVVLDVADVVQDQRGEGVELGQLLRQPEVALGRQQALHQRGGRGPEHRVIQGDEGGPEGGDHVAFPRAGPTNGDHIDRLGDERALAQALDRQLQGGTVAVELQRREGLLARQLALHQAPLQALLRAMLALGAHQLGEKRLMAQVLLRSGQRNLLMDTGHAAQVQGTQALEERLLAARCKQDGARHRRTAMATAGRTPPG